MSTKGMRKNIIFGVFFKFNKAPTYNKKYAYIIFFKFFIQCKSHNTKDEIKENGRVLSCQSNKIDTGIQYS